MGVGVAVVAYELAFELGFALGFELGFELAFDFSLARGSLFSVVLFFGSTFTISAFFILLSVLLSAMLSDIMALCIQILTVNV